MVAPVSGALVMSVGMGVVTKNYVYPVIIALASAVYPVIMVLRQRESEKRVQAERARIREAYSRRVQDVERELVARRSQQADSLSYTYPTPAELRSWAEAASPRLWERRPEDKDFLELRMGTGDVPASFSVRLPGVEIPELAPPLLLQARQMAQGYALVSDVPVSLPLKSVGSAALTGPRAIREAAARALLCSLVGLHSPAEVELFAVYPPNRVDEWSWLKWLPHTRALEGGGRQHLAYEPSAVRSMLSGLMDELHAREIRPPARASAAMPSIVLFVADLDLVRAEALLTTIMEKGKTLDTYLILLAPSTEEVPEGCSVRLEVLDPRAGTYFGSDRVAPTRLKPELTELPLAEGLARAEASIRLGGGPGPEDLPDEIRLLDLLGVTDAEALDFESRWSEAAGRPPTLETLLGLRHGQRPLVVDLRQSGVGPHGLIAGTTGSGKSELLLTLLTGLALNHHPHQVNFVLVDYKGGTAMSVLAGLPHTVGVVTDLDGRQTRRALVALRSEMARREEILNRYHVADIDKYHLLGHSEPFPYLFIVIDEFAELREHFKNDLTDVLREFVSVAQKGRALGVHLILAMQKPEGVVNDSIRANIKFRACLRVERAEDSRNVLGRPDAYLLPNRPPGRAYFQVGKDEQFDLFQVARIAGFHRPAERGNGRGRTATIFEVAPDGRRIPLLEWGTQEPAASEPGEVQTEAQVLVDRAKEAARRMGIRRLPSPWPEPLPRALPVDDLFSAAGRARWDGTSWPAMRTDEQGWPIPVALLDEPARQRQLPFELDLAREGCLLVVGAPGSGKTTFLLTLVAALTQVSPPDLLTLHLVDFGGHRLRAAFSGFPHVAGIYAPSEPDRIRRLLSTLEAELESRKAAFAQAGVTNLAALRRAAPEGGPFPAVVVAIHNFAEFSEAFADELSGWINLIRAGGPYGLHLVLTSDRQPSTRISDLIQTRVALRLADSAWYPVILGTRPDLTTYDPSPGRGFVSTKPPTELQVATPMQGTAEEQLALLQQLGRGMDAAWKGVRPGRPEHSASRLARIQSIRRRAAGHRGLGVSPSGVGGAGQLGRLAPCPSTPCEQAHRRGVPGLILAVSMDRPPRMRRPVLCVIPRRMFR